MAFSRMKNCQDQPLFVCVFLDKVKHTDWFFISCSQQQQQQQQQLGRNSLHAIESLTHCSLRMPLTHFCQPFYF